MSEFDQAKIVRRSQLRSPSCSSDTISSSDEARRQWRRQLECVYQADHTILHAPDLEKAATADTQDIDQPGDQAYEFRLFSTKTNPDESQGSNNPAIKIRITSPEATGGDAGFTCPRRPQDYYFATGDEAERKRYELVAVDGLDVLKEGQVEWPGFRLPWRVTTIINKPSGRRSVAAVSPQAVSSGKRKRIGKKRRIAIRVKMQAQEVRKGKVKQAETRTVEEEREKRNRKNREKKVKKREKREKARAMKSREDVKPENG